MNFVTELSMQSSLWIGLANKPHALAELRRGRFCFKLSPTTFQHSIECWNVVVWLVLSPRTVRRRTVLLGRERFALGQPEPPLLFRVRIRWGRSTLRHQARPLTLGSHASAPSCIGQVVLGGTASRGSTYCLPSAHLLLFRPARPQCQGRTRP